MALYKTLRFNLQFLNMIILVQVQNNEIFNVSAAIFKNIIYSAQLVVLNN